MHSGVEAMIDQAVRELRDTVPSVTRWCPEDSRKRMQREVFDRNQHTLATTTRECLNHLLDQHILAQ